MRSRVHSLPIHHTGQQKSHSVAHQAVDDLDAMRRMTDSNSVNLLLASDKAAVRRESCSRQSASTCIHPVTRHDLATARMHLNLPAHLMYLHAGCTGELNQHVTY